MPILKDLAHVLRVYEQGNTSQVVVFLGRRCGQMRVLAKGARRSTRKGFEGGFDLLSRGELLVYPRRDESLWIFKEWDERVRRPGLGRSWEALRGASFLCELAEALTRESAGAAPFNSGDGSTALLYDLLAHSSDALARGFEPGPLLLFFALRALEILGFLPDLSRCSRCGEAWPGAQALAGTGPRVFARPLARLGAEGLECNACAMQKSPERALEYRSAWLTIEALRALAFVKRTGKGVRLSRAAAEALARTLLLLVHGALERDLRTLRWAAQQILRMGDEREKK